MHNFEQKIDNTRFGDFSHEEIVDLLKKQHESLVEIIKKEEKKPILEKFGKKASNLKKQTEKAVMAALIGLVFITPPAFAKDKMVIEQIQPDEKIEEIINIEKKSSEILKKSEEIKNKVGNYFYLIDQEKIKIKKSEYNKKIKIKGFDKSKIKEADINNFLNDYVPKQWQVNLGIIEYVDEIEEMPEAYGLNSDNWHKVAECIDSGPKTRAMIKIFKYDVEYIPLGIMIHEIAHANDWQSSFQISRAQRINFYWRVMKLMESQLHFQSDYVNEIKNKDKNKEFYLKTREYWAEICEEYFTHFEGVTSSLTTEEIQLIRDVLQMQQK